MKLYFNLALKRCALALPGNQNSIHKQLSIEHQYWLAEISTNQNQGEENQ
jgi:hypothetical protein